MTSEPSGLVTVQLYCPSSEYCTSLIIKTDEVGQDVAFILSFNINFSSSLFHITSGMGEPLKAQLMLTLSCKDCVISEGGDTVILGAAVKDRRCNCFIMYNTSHY